MRKENKLVLLGLGLFIGLTGFGAKTQAHASSIPSNYSFDGSIVTGPIPYYTKSAYTKSTSKAYIWNTSHTKRLHNLKNYPNTIWNVNKATVKKVNGNREIYYQLASVYNPKVTGVAWSGYFNKNLLKEPNLFTSDATYTKYINSTVSLEITKGISSLFPKTPVSVNLSKYFLVGISKPDLSNLSHLQFLQFQSNGVQYVQYDNSGKVISTKNYKNNFYNSDTEFANMSLTPSQYLKQIKSELEQAGFTADKRASMGNYQIGINAYAHAEAIDNQSNYNLASKTYYPILNSNSFFDEAGYNSSWSILLGVPTK